MPKTDTDATEDFETPPQTERHRRRRLELLAKIWPLVLIAGGLLSAGVTAHLVWSSKASAATVQQHSQDITEIKVVLPYLARQINWSNAALWKVMQAQRILIDPPPTMGLDAGVEP